MATFGAHPPGSPDPRTQRVNQLVAEARAAMRAGQYEKAGRTAEMATQIDPSRYEPWMIVCDALTKVGSADAEKAMAFAINVFTPGDPFRTILEADRSQALAEQARMDEAVAQARIAASRPEIAWASHRVIASALLQAGLYEEALDHAEKAYAGLPGDANVNYTLATAYRFLGRLQDAEAAHLRGLAAKPDDSLTYHYGALAGLRKWGPGDNHVAAMRGILSRGGLGVAAVARLRYGLFKELHDLGRTEEAWMELAAAGNAAKKLLPFDIAERTKITDALIETFSADRLRSPSPQSLSGPQPIFIIGLPRSGTTLVERILAAHSRVRAMGETTGLGRAVKAAARTPGQDQLDVATIRAAGSADSAEVARLYQKHTDYLAHGADIVTEKLPHNYYYAGVMRLAFPQAPMIHVLRSPMDTLFGAYRLLFGEGAYSWSYTLPDLAANYRLYRRLMDHWRQALGDAFIEIRLEDLIDRPDVEIPRLIGRCGLEFEAACLTPEAAEGGVSTASSAQIRSPINREGVGAWRRYAKQLEPLRAELERDGFVDADGEAIWG